eukprot:6409409-Prymnesium_polylepis.2
MAGSAYANGAARSVCVVHPNLAGSTYRRQARTSPADGQAATMAGCCYAKCHEPRVPRPHVPPSRPPQPRRSQSLCTRLTRARLSLL